MSSSGMAGSGDDEPRFARGLLRRHRAGELSTDELLGALYDELRAMADALMKDERDGHTLQPTALVHEAFLRLADADLKGEHGRLSFLAAASTAMRRVLVDHARARKADKRGGGRAQVTLAGLEDLQAEGGVDLVALHEALERLAALDARQARIVELRFFSGMTGAEIAEHLGVSRNTVVRELTMARAWLASVFARDDA